jgi:hypothetical protein
LDQGYSGGNEEFKIWQISVATRPLSAVLAENNVVDIDFLKIDVEGGEADVLAGLDLRRWRPAVMVLEAMTPTRPPRPPRPNHQRWERTVIDAGYVFVYFDGLNRFYVRKESDELRKHFRIPVSVMDEGRRYRELGNSLMNRSHPHHVFATALARKLLSSFSADELGDAMPIFTRDLSPDFLASLATVEIAATLIRQVFARAPRKDEASDRLSGREITAAQFLSELLGSTEFRMICARVAV